LTPEDQKLHGCRIDAGRGGVAGICRWRGSDAVDTIRKGGSDANETHSGGGSDANETHSGGGSDANETVLKDSLIKRLT
jgi:hypothetical protein